MNKSVYTVEKMCLLLGISRTSYYAWLKGGSKCNYKKDKIRSKVLEIFEESKLSYGSPRIHDELKNLKIDVSKSTVARVMKSLEIQARAKKKFKITTDSNHEFQVFENKLSREFEAKQVNEKWVSDITYIWTSQGWTYLTVIMDLAERMIVAWNLSKDMSAQNTTVKTLNLAMKRRKIGGKLLFHSDRGVQYCCSEFRNIIAKSKYIEQSMSRKGNCWDNAAVESFFKTLKTEWVGRFKYEGYAQAQTSIFDYIERWYNTKRKHSSLNYMSPLQKHYFLTRTAA